MGLRGSEGSTRHPDIKGILNKRKVKRPSKEELKDLLSDTSYCAIGRMYGVTDNAVRKWAKCYNLI